MTIELKSAQFRQEREASWRELEELLKKVERVGPRRLTAKELTALPQLYRAALSSLSVARAISLDKNVTNYLEALVNRAYFQVYANKQTLRATVMQFVFEGFPQAFRRYWGHMAVATAFVALGTIVGTVLTVQKPEYYYAFVNAELAGGRDPEASREELLSFLYTDPDEVEENGISALSGFAGYLFTNNFRVAILCFVVGIIPAVPVFYLLFSTGLMLGGFAGIHYSLGLSVDLWGWLLPHGITEIFAVIVCGGAGLALGQSLVFPGKHSRLQNLGRIGREASIFAVAAGLMLVYAALIEGYFRQLVNNITVRYVVAAASLIFWILYLSLAGRRPVTTVAGGQHG
ncbi:MAG: stage II sporulation protein M [Planctomycetota bacterium]